MSYLAQLAASLLSFVSLGQWVGPGPERGVDPAPAWAERIEDRLEQLAARANREPEAQRSAAEVADADPQLTAALSRIAATAGGHTQVGISVRDLDTGATVFDWQGDQLLNPASNHKILTATAAVELLGSEYRFETRIVRDDHALYLIGGADPSLQVADLEAMARALGEDALDGIDEIIVDDSMFSPRRFGPGYDPSGPGFSYMAPSGALSLQFNTVEIKVRPGRAGEPLLVSVQPPCEHVVIDASAAHTVRGRGLSIETRGKDDHTVVAVRGGLAAGRASVMIRRRVDDPGLFTGSALATLLAGHGTPLPVSRGRAPAEARELHRHRSAPLAQVLESALKYSNNFTTEQVLRTLGHLASGEPGDWDNGRAVLLRFWNATGGGSDELRFENASGLSRLGRVSARGLVDVVALWADEQAEAAAVVGALPVAGRDGTLRRRLRRTGGRVRAKTGTIAGASALTGVVTDRRGHARVGFSILVNGASSTASARRLQDRVVQALAAR